ncbi:hypothetical protein [Fervidicoccus fontis]|uniref:Uncharacterized protein n=1 Tax=Fervidicoccus fontis TaxID=683846 RepID=A0A7C2VAM2_9CREN|nr:hypothetical protein [Fervidicoccus fontis]PMB77603.1 MAG: hypothetical protein C0177_02835 [Fervidicoccus fontis]HEW63846.1 hypothetical protein [Fervidicoccus fontis]
MSEELSNKSINCKSIGYLNICENDVIEYKKEELVLSDVLRKIEECIDRNRCSKGVLLAEDFMPIRKVDKWKYLEKAEESLENVISSGKEKLVMKGKINLSEILKSSKYSKIKNFEPVSIPFGIILGVRYKNSVLIPSESFSDFRQSDQRAVQSFFEIRNYFPLLSYAAFSLLKVYRKLLYVIDLPVTIKGNRCPEKGFKLQCYSYSGSARCIFDPNIICPLRVLYRRPNRELYGGVFYWLNTLRMIIEDKEVRSSTKPIDTIVTSFLTYYLYGIALSLSESLFSLIGKKEYIDRGSYSFSEVESGITQLKGMTNNYKLKEFMDLSMKELREIKNSSNPYEMRTRSIISLDNLMLKTKILRKTIVNDSIYSSCHPAELHAGIIEGYINTYFPLLRGSISKIVSEKISMLLRINGCIEPSDLSSILESNLSSVLLNILTEKNLLSKKKGIEGYVYFVK